jgi:lipopolysaccharide transport system ATP-binding protein
LRVGIYLSTVRGEYVFTSFDVDDAALYEKHSTRQAGHYVSRCTIPGDLLNEGRYILGINASSFGVKRYFMDENALGFTVDPSAAPGMQWAEQRQGPFRPRLNWSIENTDR